jgi:ShK domain-like
MTSPRKRQHDDEDAMLGAGYKKLKESSSLQQSRATAGNNIVAAKETQPRSSGVGRPGLKPPAATHAAVPSKEATTSVSIPPATLRTTPVPLPRAEKVSVKHAVPANSVGSSQNHVPEKASVPVAVQATAAPKAKMPWCYSLIFGIAAILFVTNATTLCLLVQSQAKYELMVADFEEQIVTITEDEFMRVKDVRQATMRDCANKIASFETKHEETLMDMEGTISELETEHEQALEHVHDMYSTEFQSMESQIAAARDEIEALRASMTHDDEETNMEFVECVDLRPKCQRWAEEGRCDIGSPYLKETCRKSCGLC